MARTLAKKRSGQTRLTHKEAAAYDFDRSDEHITKRLWSIPTEVKPHRGHVRNGARQKTVTSEVSGVIG